MANTRDLKELERVLQAIDRKGYGAYARIEGAWAGDGFTLVVDRVQRDPFATPTRVRLRIPHKVAQIPWDLREGCPRKVATEDFLLRTFANAARNSPRVGGSGRSGDVGVDAGGAEIIARSGCEITEDDVELRFRIGLPATGRSVLGREAAELLCQWIPKAVQTVHWERLDRASAREWADLAEDHDF
jgi:predicted ABC-class ATPase